MNISANYSNSQIKYAAPFYVKTSEKKETTENSDIENSGSSVSTTQDNKDKTDVSGKSENSWKSSKWYSFLTGLFRHSNTDSNAHKDLKPKEHEGTSAGDKAERYANNILLHLVGNDAPSLMSIAANAGTLPPCLAPLLGPLNTVNAAAGVVSIAADLRETAQTFKNPESTKMDKLMDASHLVLGDFVSTAASVLPLITPITTPLAATMFVGGQLLGFGMDVAKTVYDIKREG